MTPQLPRIDRKLLRNAATPEAVERVWQRLENEAPLARTPRALSAWSLALASVTFAAGLVLGVQWNGSGEVGAQASPEPPLNLAPAGGQIAPQVIPSVAPRATTPRAVKRLRREEFVKASAHPEPRGEVPAAMAAPSAPSAADAGPPEWMQLANLGDYTSALQSLETEGGFDEVLNHASADRLMAAVDVARATGQKGRALQALRQVLEQFGGSPEAPLAAWTLGNMLEQAGDQVGAAAAFAWYQRLSPRGDFAEDAVVRQLEALVKLGQTDEARRLAKSYESEFPESLRLRELGADPNEATKAPAGVGVPGAPGATDAAAAGADAQPVPTELRETEAR